MNNTQQIYTHIGRLLGDGSPLEQDFRRPTFGFPCDPLLQERFSIDKISNLCSG